MDITSNDLFNSIDIDESLLFSSEFQNIIFNNNYDIFADVNIDLNNFGETSSVDGDHAHAQKLQLVTTDHENNTKALNNYDLSYENLIEQQNLTEINFPTPQEAIGGDAGIKYLVSPGLFNPSSGNISVKQQPQANTRLRYSSDGIRYLPDSRYHPLSIELPSFLKGILLTSGQILGVVLTLTTITDAQHPEMIVHQNDILYRVDGAIKIGYGCTFVPIDVSECTIGEKKFSRLSIIYKKCDEYSFQLIPFNTTTMFGPAQEYISSNVKNIAAAARGKDFKKDYNLLSYKIIFQLAVKEGDYVYISDISCETDDIHETAITTGLATPKTKGTKRASSFSTVSSSEEDSTSNIEEITAPKKFKPMDSLPITRNNC